MRVVESTSLGHYGVHKHTTNKYLISVNPYRHFSYCIIIVCLCIFLLFPSHTQTSATLTHRRSCPVLIKKVSHLDIASAQHQPLQKELFREPMRSMELNCDEVVGVPNRALQGLCSHLNPNQPLRLTDSSPIKPKGLLPSR